MTSRVDTGDYPINVWLYRQFCLIGIGKCLPTYSGKKGVVPQVEKLREQMCEDFDARFKAVEEKLAFLGGKGTTAEGTADGGPLLAPPTPPAQN